MNPIMVEFKAQFLPSYYDGIPDQVIEKTFMYQRWLFRHQIKVLALTMRQIMLTKTLNLKLSAPFKQMVEAERYVAAYYKLSPQRIHIIQKMAEHMAVCTPESISWWIYKFSQMYHDRKLHFKD
jgi:hypothetical protein